MKVNITYEMDVDDVPVEIANKCKDLSFSCHLLQVGLAELQGIINKNNDITQQGFQTLERLVEKTENILSKLINITNISSGFIKLKEKKEEVQPNQPDVKETLTDS